MNEEEAQQLLRDHNVAIDSTDGRSYLDIARWLNLVEVELIDESEPHSEESAGSLEVPSDWQQ